MARYEQLYADDDGWSPWRWPVDQGYRFACCHCGLVHDIEATAHRLIKGDKALPQPAKNQRIRWRFRVNHRSTAQVRRHMNGRGHQE